MSIELYRRFGAFVYSLGYLRFYCGVTINYWDIDFISL